MSSLPGDADDASPIAAYTTRPVTISPDAAATEAREIGLTLPSRRLPVVDAGGKLVGVVAITRSLDGFCGTPERRVSAAPARR